jgi:hypothetical protein
VQRTQLGHQEQPPIGDRSRQLLALLGALDAYEYTIGGRLDAVLDWLTADDTETAPVLDIWLTKPAPTTVRWALRIHGAVALDDAGSWWLPAAGQGAIVRFWIAPGPSGPGAIAPHDRRLAA